MEARRTIYAILNDDIVINKDLLKRIDKESGEPSDTSDSIVCWPPIPDGWCINLDGKNHTISGLYINESGKAALANFFIFSQILFLYRFRNLLSDLH